MWPLNVYYSRYTLANGNTYVLVVFLLLVQTAYNFVFYRKTVSFIYVRTHSFSCESTQSNLVVLGATLGFRGKM